MKLLINASILSENKTGLGVYTFNFLENVCPLLNADKAINYEIICRKKEFLPQNCQNKFVKIDFKNPFQRNMAVSKICKKDKYDLVWSTTQHGILFNKTPQIITIHDLTPVFYPKGRIHQTFYYRFILPLLVKRSLKIITVSKSTKDDIASLYKVKDPKKISVIYQSIEKVSADSLNSSDDVGLLLKRYNIAPKDYFTITGINYSYKNIQSVIYAFYKHTDLKSFKVLIIGNASCSYGRFLKRLVKKHNLEGNVVFAGFVSNKDKNTLLDNSFASIYPSLYEGFGIPVLEAMQHHIPVICSNLSSLPESGGNAAIYFDPQKKDDLYLKIKYLIDNKPNIEKTLSLKEDENLARFDWKKSANEIYKIIKDLINK
jgi:glycosyltransferase involved in cell wall biosynthesis